MSSTRCTTAMVAALLPAAFACPQEAVERGTSSTDILEEIRREGLESSRVMEWQDHLCNNIGGRLTGSDNYRIACEWTRQQFADMGLDARLEEWAEWKLVWNRGQWMGRMLEPEELELQVATPAWSAPTKGQVKGVLLAVPKNTGELKKLRKKIERHGPIYLFGARPRGDDEVAKALRELMQQEQILGTVQSAKSTRMTDQRFENQIRVFGNRTIALGSWERRPRTPQIIVRDDQAVQLEKRLKGRKDVVVEFEIRNRFRSGPIALHNVVADLKGTEKPEEMVIICAHLDSWHQATGATDNGTGVCSTLEAARILTKVGAKPKRTIRFILWGGEEQGLLGSGQYVVQHRREMHRVSAVFNHDSGTNWAHKMNVTEAMYPQMKKVFRPIFALSAPNPKHKGPTFELGKSKVMKPAGGGSDHASFGKIGVPAWSWGLTGELPYGYGWHSQWDTYDIVVPEYQAHNATVFALAAYGVANLDELLSRKNVERRKPRGGVDAEVLVEATFALELEDGTVTEVVDGGLGQRAGMKVGDAIVELWGEPVETTLEMARALRENSKAKFVSVTVSRDGKKTIGLRAER